MASITIDIDAESQKLDTRWQELSDMSLNPMGTNASDNDHRRAQITFWKSDILFKQFLLDQIKTDKQAAQVTIKQIKQEEVERAQAAMAALNKVIQADQVFQNVINVVTTILIAANTVITTAAK
jgi:hypothetical protein